MGDFRWGIRDHANDIHNVTQICLEEIRRSATGTVGPCVVFFGTQRYGFQPLPATLGETEFETLISAPGCFSREELALAQEWYLLDLNKREYVLQPKSSKIAELNLSPKHKAELEETWKHHEPLLSDLDELQKFLLDKWEERSTAGWAKWEAIESILRKCLHGALKVSGLAGEGRPQWCSSITEQEMDVGLETPHRVVVFERFITGLVEEDGEGRLVHSSAKAKTYTNVLPAPGSAGEMGEQWLLDRTRIQQVKEFTQKASLPPV